MSHPSHAGLLVVDVQNDFCAGGALPVPGSAGVIGALNRHLREAVRHGLTIYASRDWHPPATPHFKAYGGPWPVHCVSGSQGARFHPDLKLPPSTIVVTKGTEPASPGYSAVEGRTGSGKPFLEDLRDRGIGHVYVGGLATDYCVKESALGLLRAGFEVTVLEDAIAGVEPASSARASAELRSAGARFTAARDAFGERTPLSHEGHREGDRS